MAEDSLKGKIRDLTYIHGHSSRPYLRTLPHTRGEAVLGPLFILWALVDARGRAV